MQSRDRLSRSGTSACHQRKSSWISYEPQPDDWRLTFFPVYCVSVGDRVAKELIQDKLKCIHVLKWYAREETAVLSWPKGSANFPHVSWCCKLFLPFLSHPHPTPSSREYSVRYLNLNTHLHLLRKATKATYQEQKKKELPIIRGAVGTQPRWCPAEHQVLRQPTSAKDVAQPFGVFQLVLLSFLGVGATLPLAFHEKPLQREAFKKSSPPKTPR